MFNLSRWLARKPPVAWKETVDDPVLGVLRLSEEDCDWWESTVNVEGVAVVFGIGGQVEPALQLILSARALVENFSLFQQDLAEFLMTEALKRKAWTHEIQQLKLESIYLFWPGRPNDAEVYFTGPDPYRGWRCGYRDGEFKHLGFDD